MLVRCTLFLSILQIAGGSCPLGLWEMNDKCYFFSYDKQSWHAAETFCKSKANGFLTSVATAFENSQLIDIFESVSSDFDDVWSGGNNLVDDGTWQWTDGTPFSYLRWKPGYPINPTSDQCISLDRNDGRYMNTNCQSRKYFICKFAQVASFCNATCPPSPTCPPPPTVPSCPSCPNGYEIHRGFCYKVTHRSGSTFEEARRICQQEGGDLASIHSPDENAYIHGLVMALPPDSTGDNCTTGRWTWIGLWSPLQNLQHWDWTDGTAVDYTNWQPSLPIDRCGGAYCVQLAQGCQYYGAWDNIPCTKREAFVVCKQQAR